MLIQILNGFLSAGVIVFVLAKPCIHWLQKKQMGQVIRTNGPQAHLSKQGTPTMGGVLILFSILISSLITCFLLGTLDSPCLWILMGVMLSIGAIGFLDDWRKKVFKNSKGLSSRSKMIWLTLIALITGILIIKVEPQSGFYLPIWHIFIHGTHGEYGEYAGYGKFWFLLLAWFVIVGGSNAVNLTDGLDGLVIIPVMFSAFGLGVLALIQSNPVWAACFHFIYYPYAINILIICSTILGAGLGFLWFNTYPAQIFMGDVGALALGGLLAAMALMLGQVILFGIMGGLFVLEALSVILQVGFYKLRKKRIFKMAPIHHHFELLGWHETKVTVRFWMISFLLLTLSLLISWI